MEILLATKNRGKIAELTKLIGGLPITVRGLDDFPQIPDVEETGVTFGANASLKAAAYAEQSGLYAVADDSGLEVFALKRAPGVLSARYAGEKSTNQENIQKLLVELSKKSQYSRNARFVCVIAFAKPSGQVIKMATGICHGRIATQPLGTKGFGYDPIFIPNGFEKSFGELSVTIKQKISHRARAINKIIRYLREISATELDQSRFGL